MSFNGRTVVVIAGLLAGLLGPAAPVPAWGEEVAGAAVGITAPRRVCVSLAVEGELHGPATGSADPARQPIAMEAAFDFVEARLSDGADATRQRRYQQATARIEVDDGQQSLALPSDARTVTVSRLGTTPQFSLPGAYLSRDELELLETPFDSLLLEDLLPGRPISADDRWPVAGDLAAGLLAIDTVETGTIEARVIEIVGATARIALEGAVDGAVDGVPTHVIVDGSFVVTAEPDEDGHILAGDVERLDAVIRERRQAGHVAAGFEVEARLSVTRAPAADAAAAPGDQGDAAEPSDDGVTAGVRRRGTAGPGMIWYRDPDGRYDLVHETGWRCVEEDSGGLVLRLLDLGALVAQCSITALPRSTDAVMPSLDEVKQHVERSLAGQFQRFDGTSETVRPEDGVRVVRVVSEGKAEGLPFRWVHYVLTDGDGHRVHATFMYEASLATRFGEADQRLIAGLRLAAETRREASLPRKTGMP